MKKVQQLAILLGVAVIFGGTVTVLARTKFEEKPENKIETVGNINSKLDKVETVENINNKSKEEISGHFDYVFNDGSMDRTCYDSANMPNLNKQLQKSDVKKFNEAVEGKVSVAIRDKGKVVESADELVDIALKKNKTNEIHGAALFLKACAALDALNNRGVQISNEGRDKILDVFARSCVDPNIVFNRILTSGTEFFSLDRESYEVFLKMLEIKDIELTKEKFEVARRDLLNRMTKGINEREKMNEEIVVVANLSDEDLKNISKNEKFKGKILCSEESAKAIKDDNVRIVKLIKEEMGKIEKLEFEKVLNAAKTLEWRNDLREKHTGNVIKGG